MRDFRDAKPMARAVRATLAAKGWKITVGESLELIAKLFGVRDWNTLSATIRDARTIIPPGETLRPRLSAYLNETVQRAMTLAGGGELKLEHLLLALTNDADASPVFVACGVDIEQMRNDAALYVSEPNQHSRADAPVTSPAVHRVIQRAVLHVLSSGRAWVTGANVLVAIFSEPESRAAEVLSKHGMTRLDAVSFIAHGIAKGGGDAAA